MSRINLPGTSLERRIRTSPERHFRTSLGRQIGTSPGRSNRIFRGRPGDIGGGRPRDVLGTNICRLGKAFDALLTDVSKAFDFLDCKSLITKRNACQLSLPKQIFIHNYLPNRKHKERTNFSFCKWLGMIF